MGALSNLGTSIVEGIQSAFEFLFIPDEENIKKKVDSQIAKFGFITEATTLFNNIRDLLKENPTPPTLSVDLSQVGDAFPYSLGNSAVALDFSWYAPYKETVDGIIVAFCYACFVLNLFRKIIPSLLNSTSSDPVTSVSKK